MNCSNYYDIFKIKCSTCNLKLNLDNSGCAGRHQTSTQYGRMTFLFSQIHILYNTYFILVIIAYRSTVSGLSTYMMSESSCQLNFRNRRQNVFPKIQYFNTVLFSKICQSCLTTSHNLFNCFSAVSRPSISFVHCMVGEKCTNKICDL